MIEDKQRLAAGALPSETYAKLIDRPTRRIKKEPSGPLSSATRKGLGAF